MDFNFYFWLEAFSKFMTGQNDTPPVPPPHMRQPEPPQPVPQPKPSVQPQQPAKPQISPPPVTPDNGTVKPEDIYFIPSLPESGWKDPEPVERITLTKEEALAQGWRFRIKNKKRARITHYLGTAKDIVIPAQIERYVINEISAGVFEKAKIDCVRIPEPVRKLGTRCFAGSSVKKIVIDGSVEEIPAEFASACGRLSDVQLHSGIGTIGKRAFEKCVSLKKFAVHPSHSANVEQSAFRESGLQAFSGKVYGLLMCGDAFENTPLWQRHQLIMQKTGKDEYTVVLVGRKAVSLRMPAGRLEFCSRSILNRKGGLHTLDCSQCRRVVFRDEAIVYTYNKGFGTADREPLVIYVPKKTEKFFFAGNTDVRYPDGTPFPPLITIISEDDSETVYELYNETLPVCALHPQVPNVRLRIKCYSHYSYRENQIYYQENSVWSRVLERITFEVPLYGYEQLFADEACHNLHFVSWRQTGQQVQVYLPSAGLIGERVHWYLLKAFHGYWAQRENRLFRSEIFDRVFRQQDNTGIQPKPLPPEDSWCWTWALCRREGIPILKQRQKILLAADVMRSTPELFPQREMYRKYLLTHRRYALKLCETLPQEYADFLRGFYEVRA